MPSITRLPHPQITFTLITGIATIVLASFRVVTQAADTGAPGSEKGQNVDCNVALLGPTSYKFSINSLILLLVSTHRNLVRPGAMQAGLLRMHEHHRVIV